MTKKNERAQVIDPLPTRDICAAIPVTQEQIAHFNQVGFTTRDYAASVQAIASVVGALCRGDAPAQIFVLESVLHALRQADSMPPPESEAYQK